MRTEQEIFDLGYGRRKDRLSAVAPPPSQGPSNFTATLLEKMSHDVKSGRVPTTKNKPWVNVGDDRQPGLRAIVRKSGAVSFHAMYQIGDSRPMVTVGYFPDTSIETARHRTEIIRQLAKKGIDPQAGLHERLLEELDEMEDKWKPRRRETVEDVLEKVLRVLGEHGIKVPAAVKTHIRSEFK